MRTMQLVAGILAMMSATTVWGQAKETLPRAKVQADHLFSAPQKNLNLQPPTAVNADVRVATQNRGDRDGNRWRYKWHNNHWWYWTPGNRWVIYHNNGWIPYDVATYNNYYPGWRGGYYGHHGGYGGRGRYYTGYRGYGPGYYGPGYYDRGYYGPGYGRGYGPGYYNNRGANVGAGIGGAIDGPRGAAAGATIGGAIDR